MAGNLWIYFFAKTILELIHDMRITLSNTLSYLNYRLTQIINSQNNVFPGNLLGRQYNCDVYGYLFKIDILRCSILPFLIYLQS